MSETVNDLLQQRLQALAPSVAAVTVHLTRLADKLAELTEQVQIVTDRLVATVRSSLESGQAQPAEPVQDAPAVPAFPVPEPQADDSREPVRLAPADAKDHKGPSGEAGSISAGADGRKDTASPSAASQSSKPMDELNATVRTLIQVLDNLRPKKEPREQPFAPGGDLFKPIQAMLSGMASAAMAAANALMGVVQASLRYVAVLTPSAAFAFQQALRDLHATIGVALLPVVQTATGFLREFAARLLPITSQLQPLVAQLGAVFTQLAGIFLERFSRLAEGLMPVLKTLTELVGIVAELTRPLDMLGNIVLEVGVAAFKVMAAVLQPIIEALKSVSPLFLMLGDALQVLQLVLQAVTETVVRTLGSLLGGFDFRSWTEGLRKGFQELLKATVLLIGSLAKLVGATTFLENLIKAFDPDPNKQSAQGLATVQNAQFQAFGDIGRSVAMQSIMAGPGGASASPEEQWRKSIADSLKAIEDGTALDQMLSDLQEAVLAKFDALIDAVKGAVWDAPRSAFHAATFGIFEKQVTLTKAR